MVLKTRQNQRQAVGHLCGLWQPLRAVLSWGLWATSGLLSLQIFFGLLSRFSDLMTEIGEIWGHIKSYSHVPVLGLGCQLCSVVGCPRHAESFGVVSLCSCLLSSEISPCSGRFGSVLALPAAGTGSLRAGMGLRHFCLSLVAAVPCWGRRDPTSTHDFTKLWLCTGMAWSTHKFPFIKHGSRDFFKTLRIVYCSLKIGIHS